MRVLQTTKHTYPQPWYTIRLNYDRRHDDCRLIADYLCYLFKYEPTCLYFHSNCHSYCENQCVKCGTSDETTFHGSHAHARQLSGIHTYTKIPTNIYLPPTTNAPVHIVKLLLAWRIHHGCFKLVGYLSITRKPEEAQVGPFSFTIAAVYNRTTPSAVTYGYDPTKPLTLYTIIRLL